MEDYIKHLYKDDLEGYVHLSQLENGQVIKIINTDYKGLRDIYYTRQLDGRKDTYITPNSFYIPFRASNNIRHYRALYIDLDLKKYSKSEAIYQVYELVNAGTIPKPSMVVDSGRGIHLYWRIEHAPKGAAYTWQELEDYLYKQLEYLGADFRATDSARLLRLPNTVNTKNGAVCKVISIEQELIYSMFELREKFLNYKAKPKTVYKVAPKGRIVKLFNSYSLHMDRISDIETLCKLRAYKVNGFRNMLLHCYAYWQGIYIRDEQQLYDIVSSFNNRFSEPLKDTEVKAILRSVPKAIKKFLDYEQGIRAGKIKRVSIGMKDKGGYWYKNETLIERLGITEEEQRHLKTIIGTNEKYRRNNERRRKERRNSNGLTQREQRKVDTIKAIKELKEQGLTLQETADRLNMTIDGVKYYLYR